MPQPQQPFLHDLVALLAAPTQVWSGAGGDLELVDGVGAQGVLHADVRVLSRVSLRVDGQSGEHIATASSGPEATFTALLRHVGTELAGTADPQVRLDRIRRVDPGVVVEQVIISSLLDAEITVTVEMDFAGDGVSIELIRMGRATAERPFPAPTGDRVCWTVTELTAQLSCPGAVLNRADDETTLRAHWSLPVPAHGQAALGWRLDLEDQGGVITAGRRRLPGWRVPASPDHRLGPWLERSLTDLNALMMSRPEHPDEVFLAAGAPWYLTLFGRDSLWAARMLLPLDLALADGTLRTLARLQGSKVDPTTAEQPGKIMHELRRRGFELGEMSLPPLYFGTIDATPLWVCLLHDAWRAGLAEDSTAVLLPHLERALQWLLQHADADGDGLVEYLDSSGHGLVNQGWKDSADSVRFADGRLAAGAVALCEVQGYAYEAAMAGADLLDAFGRPGADRCRAWARILAGEFRAKFWCGAGTDRYPALALDGDKRRVDALTSNIGHLLGTGLLDAEEERLVAARVSGPELDSGLGLRTMSGADAGYAPLSYHCGSVWPHDTAIVIAGLLKAGLRDHAGGLIEGLLRASVAFDARLPELYSGEGRPVPYPASCRPQAWSAASAVVVAGAWQA